MMRMMVRFRGSAGLLALSMPWACASHGPVATPATGTSDGPASVPATCEAGRLQAQKLADAGRLWSAKRALAGCEAEAQPLLDQVNQSLGEARRSKRSSDPKPVVDFAPLEQQLSRGDCAGALAAAEAHYQKLVPSAAAAVLAGQAAACLKRETDAQRWYARAQLELELEGASAGWTLPPMPKSASWRGPSSLSLRTSSGAASLSDASGKGQWVWQTQSSPVAPAPWLSDKLRIVLEEGALVGQDPATQRTVWRHALPPRAEVQPAFAEDQVLVLARRGNTFHITYEQLELASGRVLKSGKVEGIEAQAVVSAPFANWFSFETPEPQQRDILVVLVDGKGNVRRQSVDKGCRPLAAWSSSELVSDCGDPRALFAVDVSTLQRRKLADKPPGHFKQVITLGERLISFSGAGGVFLLQGAGSGATVVAAPELSGVDWSDDIDWSADRTRFAAVGKAGDRRFFVVYNLQQHRVESRITRYVDRRRFGFALARDRQSLALGSCPELQSFDLARASYGAAPFTECSPLLASLSPAGFAVVDPAGRAFSWRPTALPQPTPALHFSQNPKQAVVGGDWVAVFGSELQPPLWHVPSGKVVSLARTSTLRAVSPDGKHVVYETRVERNGVVDLAFALAAVVPGDPPRIIERWQVPYDRDVPLLFSRDGQTLYFLIKPPTGSNTAWQALDIASLRVTTATRGAELEAAVDLSEDGTKLLHTSSISYRDGRSTRLAHARWTNVDEARRDGLSFAANDQLVVARQDGDALLWRATDAAFLGRLQPLAGGGALFITTPPRDPKSNAPETGTALLQLFGAHAGDSLRCVVGDRLYGWEVCADRYEDASLFRRTLSSAAR